MCNECESVHKMDTEDGQLHHILSENMRMIPEGKEFDKFGPYLNVSHDDWDELHIIQHQAFLNANTLRPQFKSKMNEHIKKHKIQIKEKERMKLGKKEHVGEIESEVSYG